MKTEIKPITKLIWETYQIDISRYDATFLKNSLEKRKQETRCVTTNAFFQLLKSESAELKILVGLLQNSHSEFFRNTLTFSVLEKIVLPTLAFAAKKKEIRIWSAACASGQETYSLAMLLHEQLSDEKTNFRIFATDQSQSEIDEGKKGIYAVSDLKNVSVKHLNKWFVKQDEHYLVKPELKKNIEFSTFDLFDEQHSCPPTSIFGDFDIIICANIFFYYKSAFRKKIITKLSKCLSAKGYLVTGETERDILIIEGFVEVFPQSAIFRTAR